jgi:hypothetical protein
MTSSIRVLEAREEIRRALTNIVPSLDVDRDGDFSFPNGSAHVFVSVTQVNDWIVAKVSAPILFNAPKTGALYKHIASTAGNYWFGHPYVLEDADGSAQVALEHCVLVNNFDSYAFTEAVRSVAVVANKIDDELKELFGGETFYDDSEA